VLFLKKLAATPLILFAVAVFAAKPNKFPKNECASNPSHPFSIEFVSCQ